MTKYKTSWPTVADTVFKVCSDHSQRLTGDTTILAEKNLHGQTQNN